MQPKSLSALAPEERKNAYGSGSRGHGSRKGNTPPPARTASVIFIGNVEEAIPIRNDEHGEGAL